MASLNWRKVDLLKELRFIKGRASRWMFDNHEQGTLPYLTPEYLRGNAPVDTYCLKKDIVQVSDGDLILLWDGSNAGEVFKAKNGALASTMSRLVVDDKKIDPDFVYYFLKGYEYKIKSQVRGSGIPHVDKQIIGELPNEIPTDMTEQCKIAEILTTLDDAIEQSEALIHKYQRIKNGLMQDLLIKGIDENGEIRDPSTHPEQFIESSIGVYPNVWQLAPLNSIYKTPIRDFGSFSMTNLITFLDSGIPFIKSEMVEECFLNTENMFYISDDIHTQLRKSWVYPGNILYSKIGSALGKALIYDGRYGICNSNAAVAKIDVDESKASKFFITHLLNSPHCKKRIKNSIVSLLPRLNLNDISNFQILLPPLSEQKRIAEVLNSMVEMINQEIDFRKKLISLKTGLMQDLLTGRVRVTNLLD